MDEWSDKARSDQLVQRYLQKWRRERSRSSSARNESQCNRKSTSACSGRKSCQCCSCLHPSKLHPSSQAAPVAQMVAAAAGIADNLLASSDEEEFAGNLNEHGANMKGECEQLMEKNKNDVSLLISMCIGLVDNKGRKIADIKEDFLYKNIFSKALLPKVPRLKIEMKRRAEKAGLKNFRKKSALKPECIRWLKSNPVKEMVDIEKAC